MKLFAKTYFTLIFTASRCIVTFPIWDRMKQRCIIPKLNGSSLYLPEVDVLGSPLARLEQLDSQQVMSPNQLRKEKRFRSRRICDSHNCQNHLEEFVPSALTSFQMSCNKSQVGRWKWGDPNSSNMQIVPALAIGAPLGLDGQTRPKYPQEYPPSRKFH